MRVNKISAVKKEFFFNSFEFNFDSTNIYIYIYKSYNVYYQTNQNTPFYRLCLI